MLASMRKTHWKHFVWRDWRVSQGQLHNLRGGVQNEKVPGTLCKKPGVWGMLFLSFCGLFNLSCFQLAILYHIPSGVEILAGWVESSMGSQDPSLLLGA